MMIWRLLASVLVVSDQGQRQRQTIKHEQAMNDSKNKTTCQPVHEPRQRAFLAFACLVCRALRCGDLGAIFARIQHFRVACLALRLCF